jgi:hypothetical protein
MRETLPAAMSSSFQFISDAALSECSRKTGIDLATYPFAQALKNCHDADAIFDLLQDNVEQFRTSHLLIETEIAS